MLVALQLVVAGNICNANNLVALAQFRISSPEIIDLRRDWLWPMQNREANAAPMAEVLQVLATAGKPEELWELGLHPKPKELDSLAEAGRQPYCYRIRPESDADQVVWHLEDEKGVLHLQPTNQLRLRSIESVSPLYLRFANNTPYSVRVLWLDYKGNESTYELVKPGGVVYQHTFLTHPWIVREVTTSTRLLLNNREVHVACKLPSLPPQPAAAEAPAGPFNAAQQQGQQQGQPQEQQQEQGQGQAAVGAAGGQVANAPAELEGLPVVTVNITALPPLVWSKQTHSFYPAPFKEAVRTFLLAHQHLQRMLARSCHGYHSEQDTGASSGRIDLGHMPHLLLPHIVGLAAPFTPQGVHFPAIARPDILPALLEGDCWARV